jgi:hypothetical protein
MTLRSGVLEFLFVNKQTNRHGEANKLFYKFLLDKTQKPLQKSRLLRFRWTIIEGADENMSG